MREMWINRYRKTNKKVLLKELDNIWYIWTSKENYMLYEWKIIEIEWDRVRVRVKGAKETEYTEYTEKTVNIEKLKLSKL